MSRSLYLPYVPSNPRTVRGARKRGWTLVLPRSNYVEKASWMGLCIWTERTCSRYWIASFNTRTFAFESGADAMAFKLKWG